MTRPRNLTRPHQRPICGDRLEAWVVRVGGEYVVTFNEKCARRLAARGHRLGVQLWRCDVMPRERLEVQT